MPEGVMTDAPRVSFRLPRLAAPLYKEVFDQQRKVHGHTFSMWVAVLPDADRRVGIVVSKKTFRRAVDRNRAKRLMREAFRMSQHWLVEGVHVILVARHGIEGKMCREVMDDFERACRRVKIWKRKA